MPRLSRQVKDYDLSYDCNIVVVGSSHGLHIREHVPEVLGRDHGGTCRGWVGFLHSAASGEKSEDELEEKAGRFYGVRSWAQIQEWNGMPKYKDRSKSFVCEKIAEKAADPEEEALIRRQVSEILFERD